MAVKRLREEETKAESEGTGMDSLPESLQICILSFIDTKHAVETSVLSKSWVSSWSCVPVLNFSSDSFKQLDVFDNFVVNTLQKRQPVKLDRLTFKRGGICDAEMLKRVFDYAFLHGVKELEAIIEYANGRHKSWTWPIWSSDSLKSLKLKSSYFVRCSFLEPRSSGLFKNLTNLHLTWVIIKDLDPFSGFPVLDKLTLVYCYLETNGKALNVHALQLSKFTFIYSGQDVGHCEFTTPKLRYFEWSGSGFPRLLKARLPVLDTVVIRYHGCCRKNQEKIMFDNLLMMLDTLYAARSLTLSAHVVRLRALYPGYQCSSYWDLNCLNLDFMVTRLSFSETLQLVPVIKANLLHKPRDAKCTIVNYANAASPCSSSLKMCAPTQRQVAQQSRPRRNLPEFWIDL